MVVLGGDGGGFVVDGVILVVMVMFVMKWTLGSLSVPHQN